MSPPVVQVSLGSELLEASGIAAIWVIPLSHETSVLSSALPLQDGPPELHPLE